MDRMGEIMVRIGEVVVRIGEDCGLVRIDEQKSQQSHLCG